MLKQNVVNIPPRETSGSTSSSRFDYQKDWSLCKMLEVHKEGKDYLFLFDYHDDLVILDSEINPQKILFYQIKGKNSGVWSLTNLTKPKKGANGDLPSIIGKLYGNKKSFESTTESINFVTNAPFSIDLSCGSESKNRLVICVAELSSKCRKTIHSQINKEHSTDNDDTDFENLTFLYVAELHLTDSATHAKGKIVDFIESIKPNSKYNAHGFYKTLFDEVKRKSNYSKIINDFEELKLQKGISRSKLEEVINNIGIGKDFDQIWTSIEATLGREGYSFREIRDYSRQWKRLEIEKMNPLNKVLKRYSEQIATSRDSLNTRNALGNTLKESITVLASENPDIFSEGIYEQSFLETIIISELYD